MAEQRVDAGRVALEHSCDHDDRMAEVIHLDRFRDERAEADGTGPPITDRIARQVLDLVHAALVVPIAWGPGTTESVWSILDAAGYRMPDEAIATAIERRTDAGAPAVDLLGPWQPDRQP